MAESTATWGGVAGEIRAEIARQNRKPRDLVGVLHLSQSSLYRRLDGTKPFTIKEIYQIAAWLGVPLSHLIAEEKAS